MTKKAEIAGTANDIFDLLTVLPSPRDAAQALALAHVRLIESAGGATEDAVRAMLRDSSESIIENWRARRTPGGA
jgi:hypothetical protein